MKKIDNKGNLPKYLVSFLTSMQPDENKITDVFECKYDEIIAEAKISKLEPQVIIDRSNTGRSFLCAVGASLRTDYITAEQTLNPVFYFAELDDFRKKQFIQDLNNARVEIKRQTEIKKAHQQELTASKGIKAVSE